MLPLPGQFDGRLVGAALHMPSDRFKIPIPVPYSPLCWGDNTGAVKRKQELSNTHHTHLFVGENSVCNSASEA